MPFCHLRFWIVRIEAVEVRCVTLPMAHAFVTAHGVERERPSVLVRVMSDGGEGWGECVALPSAGYSDETAASSTRVLVDRLAPRLLAGEQLPSGTPMAVAALEMAVLDAELRMAGQSLGERLGATASRVPSGIALGLDATVDDAVAAAAAGYHRVKLKVEPGGEDIVRAVRDALPHMPLQVDGNGAYTGDSAELLDKVDDLGLLLIEQPLGVHDWDGHVALARRLRTPICLDESIVDAAAAARALDRGACQIVNVKPGRVGGYLEAVRVHDECVARGAAVWCGGMLETALARTANLALAALPGFTLPGDISPSSRWFLDDVAAPVEMDADGWFTVPHEPGIGITPDAAALTRLTTSLTIVRP